MSEEIVHEQVIIFCNPGNYHKLTNFIKWRFWRFISYYPGQQQKKKEPSSRFAARRTLFHVWYHARSGAISAGQKSHTVVDRTCPALITPDRAWYPCGTAFFSPQISRMVLFFVQGSTHFHNGERFTVHFNPGKLIKHSVQVFINCFDKCSGTGAQHVCGDKIEFVPK